MNNAPLPPHVSGRSGHAFARVWRNCAALGWLAFALLGPGCVLAPADVETGLSAQETADDDAPYDAEELGEDELMSTSQALEGGQFCWKDSYGRGVGTIPDSCPGQQYDAGLCYPHCASGYYGVGPVCWQACPAGYRDDGTACWIDTSIISANNSQCPWYDVCGLTFARGCSTCPSGYVNDGCTCRRDVQMFYKHTYGRGVGAPMQCNPAKQYDAGLCYDRCAPGYGGVGPVCWGECPPEAPVQCGAGCASSSAECADQLITQITASLECAGNLASMAMSLGSSAAVKYVTKVGMSAAEKAALKAKIKQELRDAFEDLAEQELEALATASAEAAAGEPFDYASLDPTGIATLVEAFDNPSCSSMFVSNRALGKPAYQSSTGYGGSASRAVDGNTSGNYGDGSTTHTNADGGAWWQVDLQRATQVQQVVVHNRTDCCSDRLANFHVELRDASNHTVARRDFQGGAPARSVFEFGGIVAHSVVVQLKGSNYLSLAEVQVMGR